MVALFAASLTALATHAEAQTTTTTITTTTLPAVCGDGVVAGSEDCDDGDTSAAPGDACTADCRTAACVKPTGSPGTLPTASDALYVLRAVVGSASCQSCVCDGDGNGSVSATDALITLRRAVGQAITLRCPLCTRVRRTGQLLIRRLLNVPASVRSGLLAQQAAVDAAGLELTPDGSQLLWPLRGANGWWVRFGDSFTTTDEDGFFTIEIAPEDGPVGTLAHPQQSDDPLFELPITLLAAVDQSPVPIQLEHEHAGPCGMNDDPAFPDPDTCNEIVGDGFPTALAEDGASQASHVHYHDGAALDASQTDPTQAKTQGPLGTYPAANQHCCRDFDGGNYDGGTTLGTLLNYMDSTCSMLIDSGCCAGELGSVKASILSSVGLLNPVSCKTNHKGRYCQEVTQGEVSVQIDGRVIGRHTIGYFLVRLGETKSVVVHNNGCFGETAVEKTEERIFGILTGPNFSGGKITHYDNPKTYVADRTLSYFVPKCIDSVRWNQYDRYSFSTDGIWTWPTFDLRYENLYKFVPNGPIFSADNGPADGFHIANPDQCEGIHVHGFHPCTGAPEPPNAGPCGQGIVEAVPKPSPF